MGRGWGDSLRILPTTARTLSVLFLEIKGGVTSVHFILRTLVNGEMTTSVNRHGTQLPEFRMWFYNIMS